jgi:hypothetical protein
MLRPALVLPALTLLAAPILRAQPEEEGRMLYRFRVSHLQQNVGLSEEQARVVADRWARFDHDLFDTLRQIREIRGQFNDILLGPGSEEEKNARVRPLLEQFVALRHHQMNLKLQFEDDIRAHLTPAQQVRLILQVEEMQRRMVEALRQGFGGRTGPGNRMRPGGGRRGGR